MPSVATLISSYHENKAIAEKAIKLHLNVAKFTLRFTEDSHHKLKWLNLEMIIFPICLQQSILIGSIMALGLGGLAALYNYGLQDQIAQRATSASICRTVSILTFLIR